MSTFDKMEISLNFHSDIAAVTATHQADCARLAGGREDSPSSLGIGAEPGHQEHRRPSTSVPTEASGWRSTVRRSMALVVPQPGQNTSSHGMPAISAARIVGNYSMSRPRES